jgi:hypothetical protein
MLENALALSDDLRALLTLPPPPPLTPSQCEAGEIIRRLHACEGTPLERRAMILRLEELLFALGGSTETNPTHHFAPGVYARELRIPADHILVGKIHKHEHLCIVSAGDITVFSEFGCNRIRAPATILSKPGAKRVGIAHTDTVWTTIHPTSKTDLAEIEDEVIAKSFDDVALIDLAPVAELESA